MMCWKKFHHPVYSFAYNFAPECHAAKPWTNPEVKVDTEGMLAKYFPDAHQQGSARAAMMKCQNFEGCFTKVNAEGQTRDIYIWRDTFLANTAPWNWLADMAATEEPDLFRSVNQALQVGVSSSINERVFSGWGHIMGKRRTRMGRRDKSVKCLFILTGA